MHEPSPRRRVAAVLLGACALACPLTALPEPGPTESSGAGTAGSDVLDVIDRLESELRTTADQDSIRFLLAVAWRETGTIEGRRTAQELFRKIRGRYDDDARYHVEIARTFLEGDLRGNARREFERALEIDPTSLEARLLIARTLRGYALRYSHPEDVTDALALLDETATLAPESKEVLHEFACCHQIARMLRVGDRTAHSLATMEQADSLLARDPADSLARGLRAVAWLDLGKTIQADRAFREIFRAGAPPPMELRASRSISDWSQLDPTPLTQANEALLEYWRRLVLADVFYGDPARAIRGSQTKRGQIFVRYGAPHSVRYEMANWSDGESTNARDLGLQRRRRRQSGSMVVPFTGPTQSWAYAFGDRKVEFRFVDPTLQGDFTLLDPSTHAEFESELPMVLLDTFGAAPVAYYFASAGRRDTNGFTQQILSLAIAVHEGDDLTTSEVPPQVRILNADGEVVQSAILPVAPLVSLGGPGSPVFWTARGHVRLKTGRYTAEVQMDAGRSVGSFISPLAVRDYTPKKLLISDIELAFSPEISNPGGFASSQTKLQVRYEAYNFSPGPDGVVRYQTRVTVVPRAYAVVANRMLEDMDGIEMGLYMGSLGASLEGVTLHARNFLDVLFPEKQEPLAPGARGGFTFELDASTLDPGEYALTVLVEDTVRGERVFSQSTIRVLAAR